MRPPNNDVQLQISPTWDVSGGNQQWRASVTFNGDLAFFEKADTIDRAVANLALTLARTVKADLDRRTQAANEAALEESR